MITVTIKAQQALDAMIFASKEETRYYLQGFLVEKHESGGVVLVSTDGHRMSVVHDPNGKIVRRGGKSDIILKLPPHVQKKIRALASTWAGTSQLSRATLVFSFVPGLSSGTVKCEILIKNGKSVGILKEDQFLYQDVVITGEFPAWRKVIPSFEDELTSGCDSYNPKYLADFAKFSPDKSSPGIIITRDAPEKSALVRVQGRKDMFGVLMPMRGSDDFDLFPEWFQR